MDGTFIISKIPGMSGGVNVSRNAGICVVWVGGIDMEDQRVMCVLAKLTKTMGWQARCQQNVGLVRHTRWRDVHRTRRVP